MGQDLSRDGTSGVDGVAGMVSDGFGGVRSPPALGQGEEPIGGTQHAASLPAASGGHAAVLEDADGPLPRDDTVAECFEAVSKHRLANTPRPPRTRDTPEFEADCNVFVKRESRGKAGDSDVSRNLRVRDWQGDVWSQSPGYVKPKDAVRRAAVKNWVKDEAALSEIMDKTPLDICCTVCVKGPEETIDAEGSDWIVGTHGLVFRYMEYAALILPDIIQWQGWTKQEAMNQVVQKAGVPWAMGIISKETQRRLFTRFQVMKMSMTYDEFCDFNINKYA